MSFPTTQWSLIAQASWDGGVESRKALETLCGRYWGAVHTFIRSRHIPDPEAQDLTQDFMLHLLQKSLFVRGDPLRGRFRSLLLGALVRFLADAADKRAALKRGGAIIHCNLDGNGNGAGKLAACPPEVLLSFDREWALTILETALDRTRAEYGARGRAALFAALEHFLPGAPAVMPYELAAERLGISLPALKSEVHRVRRRFRAIVREEVGQTVSAPHEIEAELAHLHRVLKAAGNDPTRRLQLLKPSP
jgi:RNA polymerase sigma-70 factor (ECF subfamily)